jgi:hypothetical protein
VHMAGKLTEVVGDSAVLQSFETSLGFDLATCDVAPAGALALRPWEEIYNRLATVVRKRAAFPLFFFFHLSTLFGCPAYASTA